MLKELVKKTVEGMGYRLIRLRCTPTKLAIYISKSSVHDQGSSFKDSPAIGITLQDCEKVFRQIEATLKAEQLYEANMSLEVSSPGTTDPETVADDTELADIETEPNSKEKENE